MISFSKLGYTYLFMVYVLHIMALVWSSEHNLTKLVLTFYQVGPGFKLRSPGLAAMNWKNHLASPGPFLALNSQLCSWVSIQGAVLQAWAIKCWSNKLYLYNFVCNFCAVYVCTASERFHKPLWHAFYCPLLPVFQKDQILGKFTSLSPKLMQ